MRAHSPTGRGALPGASLPGFGLALGVAGLLAGCPDGGSPGAPAAPPAAPAAAPSDASANTAPAILLVASKSGEVYHLPSCRKALEIAPENRVEYATPGKARSAGKRRCKECSPP